jgi:hypothetical protein
MTQSLLLVHFEFFLLNDILQITLKKRKENRTMTANGTLPHHIYQ